MSQTTNPNTFANERKNTDNSLVAERDKASRSIEAAHSESQDKTDATVQVERDSADRKTARSREDHDTGRDGSNVESSTDESQKHLREERRRSDVATGLERSRVDAAILKERVVSKNVVNRFSELERQATDNSLSIERGTTDDKLECSTNDLKSELAKHARTRSSLTTRDEFLAIVSHDLRNPIGSVVSYAELLNEGFDGEVLGPQSQRAVATIKRNALASLRLIEDLLDVERISQDKLDLRKISTSATRMIEDAVESALPRAAANGIKLDVKPSAGDAMVSCDRDRILQVLGNLIGNAIKFTPAGQVVRVSKTIDGDNVTFFICDTGPGIPQARQVQIFERFAQLKSINRDGLGLGLYISKMLVEAHHGLIEVQSTPGEGTTFKFSLPLV